MNTHRSLRILTWVVAAVVLMASGRGIAAAAPQRAEQTAAKTRTVQMRIAGMTCASCAKGLEASFRRMAGVEKVAIDHKSGLAVITFDTAKQSPESLSKFVATCGYQVKETKVV